MALTVRDSGWQKVRSAVFHRDGGCVAGQWRVFGKDVADEPCKDIYGDEIPYNTFSLLELDHVTDNHGIRRDAEAFLITVCPWHHRLSQQWRSDSKAHRQAEREYLARLYPMSWAA